jgi:nitroreductase
VYVWADGVSVKAGLEKEKAAILVLIAALRDGPAEWCHPLVPLCTDEHKRFRETAPWLIVIFAQSYALLADGRKVKNYYVQESIGIATGLLVTALHRTGLATLTHAPNPKACFNGVLGHPANERPFMILVVGYPAEDARVPATAMQKKWLEETAPLV